VGDRFLALGDSYTIGEGVAAAERWPTQLAGLLRARGVAIGEPLIVARTGWTTDELSAALDAAAPTGTFDLVTLLIGVNDQYRGGTAGAYREPFRRLLRRAIGYAGGRPARVLVVAIPDWGITPFAASRDRRRISAEIDAFNAVNRDEAAMARAVYGDIAPLVRTAQGDRDALAADGLHPSGSMYAAWADLLCPTALAMVNRSTAARAAAVPSN
jgi:lysophospholipase L1-like esterase